MNYKEFSPSEELNGFVKCYWTLENEAEKIPTRQNIVPDGCMEMIFQIGDLYKQYISSDEAIVQPRCFVFGQITKPLEIEATGTSNIFSVRFHPDGFLPFSSIPLKELENKANDLTDIFGTKGNQLASDVLSEIDTDSRIKVIESFLLNELNEDLVKDKIAKDTVETIFKVNGQTSIEELSQKLNVNRRQIERKVMQSIGLSPKQLSKTIRLNNTLKSIIKADNTTLTEIALENGYFDQAHFIKDFKELTGLTPKQFYGENLKMSISMNK
ncbi:MAG TPA: helix-turn-helix domain-containing protein [Bacteroidia bacterium]